MLRRRGCLGCQTRRRARGRLRNLICQDRRCNLHWVRAADGRHAGHFSQRLRRLRSMRVGARCRSARAAAPVTARVRRRRAAASPLRLRRRAPRQELLPGQMLPPASRTSGASIPQEVDTSVVAQSQFGVSIRRARTTAGLLELHGGATGAPRARRARIVTARARAAVTRGGPGAARLRAARVAAIGRLRAGAGRRQRAAAGAHHLQTIQPRNVSQQGSVHARRHVRESTGRQVLEAKAATLATVSLLKGNIRSAKAHNDIERWVRVASPPLCAHVVVITVVRVLGVRDEAAVPHVKANSGGYVDP